ncbi:MAG TPA: hypothetical protein VHG93_08060 [Longimicrobium sp.]|nr:hypothetical protein [Longimicrobium sp.]
MSDAMHRALGRSTRTAGEIAAELRREFALAMEAQHGTHPLPDPVLATLFHTLAVQVARVYEEAERVFPVTVLDDLVAGLAMEPRLASPAQAVVRFAGMDQRETLSPETQLWGFTRTGAQVGFAPDEAIDVSRTTLAFAAVHEGGRLHAVPGARVAGGGIIPPGSVPLALEGAAPTLWLAFDADEGHLGGLGLFLDAEAALAEALARSPWQLLGPEGTVREEGMLRSTPGRGGVRRLAWFHEAAAGPAADGPAAVVALPDGPYGGRVWVFPPVPAGRRNRGAVPLALRGAAPLLLPEGAPHALNRPLVWVQVPLPAGTRGVTDALHRVEPHCVTASNVEVASEQVTFDRMGTAVRLCPEGSRDRHVMGVLSVTGQRGARYAEESALEGAPEMGRWRYREGHLELRPARHATGLGDDYAMARLLYCDGEKANGMEIGAVCRVDAELANVTLQVANLTVSRGGAAPPPYAPARLRFAELLRTRERVVTAADVEAVARAFDPRIAGVEVESRANAGPEGVTLTEEVTARVRPGDFADPEGELPRLRAALQEHLQRRSVLGHQVRVVIQPLAGGAR